MSPPPPVAEPLPAYVPMPPKGVPVPMPVDDVVAVPPPGLPPVEHSRAPQREAEGDMSRRASLSATAVPSTSVVDDDRMSVESPNGDPEQPRRDAAQDSDPADDLINLVPMYRLQMAVDAERAEMTRRYNMIKKPPASDLNVNHCRPLNPSRISEDISKKRKWWCCPHCGYCSPNKVKITNHIRHFAIPGACFRFMNNEHPGQNFTRDMSLLGTMGHPTPKGFFA